MLLILSWRAHRGIIMVMAGGDRISVEELDEDMVKMYVEEMKLKKEEVFLPYKKLCKSRKVDFFFCIQMSS